MVRKSLSQDPDLLAIDRELIGESTLALVNTTPLPLRQALLHLLMAAEGLRRVRGTSDFSAVENAVTGFHALQLKVAGRFEAWLNNRHEMQPCQILDYDGNYSMTRCRFARHGRNS